MSKCWRCNTDIEVGETYCHNCGASLAQYPQSSPPPPQTRAQDDHDHAFKIIAVVLVIALIISLVVSAMAFGFFWSKAQELTGNQGTPTANGKLTRENSNTLICTLDSVRPSFYFGDVWLGLYSGMNGSLQQVWGGDYASLTYNIDNNNLTVTVIDNNQNNMVDNGDGFRIAMDHANGQISLSVFLVDIPTGKQICTFGGVV